MQVSQKTKKKNSTQLITKQFKRSQNISNLIKISPQDMLASYSSFNFDYHKNRNRKLKSFQFEQSIGQEHSFEAKRKSFQDFLESSQSQNLLNKRVKKQQDFQALAISYDNKIKPIHHYSRTIKQQQKQISNNTGYIFNVKSPPKKCKANFKVSNYRRIIYLPHTSQQVKDQKFKGLKDCMKPVKYCNTGTKVRFKTRKSESERNNLDCGPWTGRRQRQQQSQQGSHILNSKC